MWHYEDEEADCTGSTDEQVAVSRPSQSPEDRIAMWHYEDEESDGSTDEQFLHDFEDCERCMDYMDYIELQEYTAFKAFRRFKKRAICSMNHHTTVAAVNRHAGKETAIQGDRKYPKP